MYLAGRPQAGLQKIKERHYKLSQRYLRLMPFFFQDYNSYTMYANERLKSQYTICFLQIHCFKLSKRKIVSLLSTI